VITLSPYDLIRIARACGISTAAARERFTLRRGSLLRFNNDSVCPALAGVRCTLHSGRPFACRLYPLGMQRNVDKTASFFRLDPAPESAGVYGAESTIADFLENQGVAAYLDAVAAYRTLLPLMRARLDKLVDFDRIEPREFWRVARREALAETNFDPNPLIDALYDPDGLGCALDPFSQTVDTHVTALKTLFENACDGAALAAASVMLQVGLGYAPAPIRIDI